MAKRIILNKSKFPRGVPFNIQKDIIDAYLSGKSTYKVGAEFGVSDFCVGNILKKHNIARRGKALKRDDEIISLYNSGKNAPQIEELLSVSASHVYDVLRRSDIKTKPQSAYGFAAKLDNKQKLEIVQLYKNGKSGEEISDKFGVPEYWIWRFLKRNNVEMRPSGSYGGENHPNWKGGLTKNKEYQNEKSRIYNKKLRDTDPLFKMSVALRNQINSSLKRNGYKKYSRTYYLLGADFQIIKRYIEERFQEGMTWYNHGFGHGKWNFDHIKPLATAKNEKDLLELFHFENLQPLWWIENIKKGSLYEGQRHYRNGRTVQCH